MSNSADKGFSRIHCTYPGFIRFYFPDPPLANHQGDDQQKDHHQGNQDIEFAVLPFDKFPFQHRIQKYTDANASP